MKSEKLVLKCNFCGHVFKRVGKNLFDQQCPKCREYDLECIGVTKSK